MLLIFVGVILGIAAGIWLLVLAFRENLLWGLAMLFVPIAGLAFVFRHWDVSKKPFLMNLCAWLFLLLGGALLGGLGDERGMW